MLFSILIPVRNDPTNLACCLESLRTQDLRDCEILIADDGSQPPIARENLPALGPRLQLLRLPGHGPASARNRLANQATGDYLFFLTPTRRRVPSCYSARER